MSRSRRRRVLGAGVAVVVIAGVVAGVLVSSGGGKAAGGVTDNSYPTSTTTVKRGSLVSQAQETGTLGYSAPTSIVLPPGGASSGLTQAQQQLATAQQALDADRTSLADTEASNSQGVTQAEQAVTAAKATLASDRSTLRSDEATLSADEQKQAVDCAGSGAAGADSASPPTTGAGSNAGSSPCSADMAQVGTDRATVGQDQAKVATDAAAVTTAEGAVTSTKMQNGQSFQTAETQLTAAELTASQARSAVDAAEADTTVGGANPVYTGLPAVGDVVKRGGILLSISDQPVWLLYGTATPDSAFWPGMDPSPAVGQLNDNLDALGFGHGLHGDTYGAATQTAVEAMQSDAGQHPTGILAIGSVIFEPAAVRITSVTPQRGTAATFGQAVLSVTSLARQVSINLDTSQESEVKVGDKVSVVLPDNITIPGVITSIGKIATTGSTPTVTVLVTPGDPSATAEYDSASVNVLITTNSANNVDVAPVQALLALASGGYALEAVGAGGAHQLVPVTLGLFDDASGMVQVSGSGVHPGLRIVIPAL